MTTWTFDQHDYLTPRELEIVRLLAQGLYPKGIADHLGIARSSVSSRITEAEKRLKATRYTLLYKAYKMEVIK